MANRGPSGNGGGDLRNLQVDVVETDVAVVLPPECVVTVEPVPHRVTAPGGSTQEALFALRRAEALQEAAGLTLVATTAGRRQEVPSRLFPTIANGGSDSDGEG